MCNHNNPYKLNITCILTICFISDLKHQLSPSYSDQLMVFPCVCSNGVYAGVLCYNVRSTPHVHKIPTVPYWYKTKFYVV